MNFIPAGCTANLLVAAAFATGALLTTSMPAAAKHGESEGDNGGHDQGRHLGWYKHGGPAFAKQAYPQYPGAWTGRQAWGGGAWAWQSGVIAGGAAWGVAWGLGPRFAYSAPPVIFVPAPVFVSLPPVVVSVPWMQAPVPYYAPPPVYVAPVAATPTDTWVPTPEAMLCAAVPPPVVVLPPPEVMILAGPPPMIWSPPAYALSVWPVIAFAPPMLAVAVLHDDWWSSRYLGRSGYYAGGYYASRGYAGGMYANSRDAAKGFSGPPMAQHHGFASAAVPFGGHGQDNGYGGGHEGGGQHDGGHGHGP